ncbi:sulfhydryl oxidase [Skeletonema marinoi]|uniref:Sulfhydryl oxidase n=1 Tax=Skeletonema marinoi TaxID=267567 RepID=A0AAD8YEQ0_9STRA|nr:sulfhydryl oxidase [Skeletonema marinoi]|eukprot:scaffold9799_cov127-Skeletonema_marinoi.AAC.3
MQLFSFLLHLLLLAVAALTIVQGREADDRSRFLYADDPAATDIIDYQLHNAPSRDYSGDERREASKNQPGSEYDEEQHIKPYFLTEQNGPRVVQFYSPWCGHCQSFKSKYIALYREVNRRLVDEQTEVHFYAVSCSVHHWVCLQHNIKGFPTIFAFKENSVDPHQLTEFTAENIAVTLGVGLKSSLRDAIENDIGSDAEGGEESEEDFRPIDILGATIDGMSRTRESVYRDAALSFTYALKMEIFVNRDGNGVLDTNQRDAFAEWIDLLYWTLPPTWILHTLINDIRVNLDAVLMSENNMQLMVEKHDDVVNGMRTTWSAQCSKGVEGAGYLCGLWSLFHIISIGVIERHRAVLGARDQILTKNVALTLRNYIEHFISCEECRHYFVDMFDSCGFNHCRRLEQSQKLPPPESWQEFPLWLWEVHNHINVKLVEAKLKSSNIVASNNELNTALWPSMEQCPQCKSGDKWDTRAVIAHLKKEYWPKGVQNFRFIVLKKKDGPEHSSSNRSNLTENLIFFAGSAIFVMWCSKKQKRHNKQHIV